MGPREKKTSEARSRPPERRERYAAAVGERVHGARDCQFSLLPDEELQRTAAQWYEACAEAMLRGNFSPLDNWVRTQARLAAEQGFQLDDLVQLLQCCRQVAIEKENWKEEYLVEVDLAINEGLAALRSQLSWTIPEGFDYLDARSWAGAREQKGSQSAAAGVERRRHRRNKLHLPILVRGMLKKEPVVEITRTENVAQGGVYFISQKPYTKGARLQVAYPYWDNPGAINREYPAEVVRVDERQGGRGVAIKFLVSLSKSSPAS